MRSTSGPARFDSGNLERGEAFRIRVVAGTYVYSDHRDRDQASYHGRLVVAATGSGAASSDGSAAGGGEAAPPTAAHVTIADRGVRARRHRDRGGRHGRLGQPRRPCAHGHRQATARSAAPPWSRARRSARRSRPRARSPTCARSTPRCRARSAWSRPHPGRSHRPRRGARRRAGGRAAGSRGRGPHRRARARRRGERRRRARPRAPHPRTRPASADDAASPAAATASVGSSSVDALARWLIVALLVTVGAALFARTVRGSIRSA